MDRYHRALYFFLFLSLSLSLKFTLPDHDQLVSRHRNIIIIESRHRYELSFFLSTYLSRSDISQSAHSIMNSFFRHFISPSSREFSSLHITSDLHRYIYLYKYIRHMDVAPGETRVGREAVVVLPLSSNYRPVFPASEKSGRSRIISDLISELFETKGKEQKKNLKRSEARGPRRRRRRAPLWIKFRRTEERSSLEFLGENNRRASYTCLRGRPLLYIIRIV